MTKPKNQLPHGLQTLTYQIGAKMEPFKLSIAVDQKTNETRILNTDYTVHQLIPSTDRQVVKRVARLLHRKEQLEKELSKILLGPLLGIGLLFLVSGCGRNTNFDHTTPECGVLITIDQNMNIVSYPEGSLVKVSDDSNGLVFYQSTATPTCTFQVLNGASDQRSINYAIAFLGNSLLTEGTENRYSKPFSNQEALPAGGYNLSGEPFFFNS